MMADTTVSKSLGSRIREMREKKGWSLTELAQRASISRSYLHQIERGESAPTEEKIRQLATALGALPSELLGEEPPTVNIPESLSQFAAQAGLESAEVRMLAQIEYRGKKPQAVDEWRAIYTVIKGMIGE
jgi:transcriptional regulator with XRE-family HTH domain